MIVMGIISLPMIGIAQIDVGASNMLKIDTILRFDLAYIYMILLGIGPSTAGYLYVIRKTVEERYCWLISDFFEAYKSNFKRSILLWIIDIFVFALLVVAFKFYSQSGLLVLQCGMYSIDSMSAEESKRIDLFERFIGAEEYTNEMMKALIKTIYVYDGKRLEIKWNFNDTNISFSEERMAL